MPWSLPERMRCRRQKKVCIEYTHTQTAATTRNVAVFLMAPRYSADSPTPAPKADRVG